MEALRNQLGMGARAACKKPLAKRALLGYKKKFAWRGTTVGPNRKLFFQNTNANKRKP
jgi:hypothetical protein